MTGDQTPTVDTAATLSTLLPTGLREARLHAPARRLADALAERNLKAALGLGETEILVGRYRLIRTLGRGGMGVVFEAHDTLLDRRVALKVMSLAGERAAAVAYKEARSLGRLAHKNVVHVFDVDQCDGLFHIAMEYIEGQSVHQWLEAEPREWSEIVEVFEAAGRGLAAAHAVGIVHCDFKPTNVLLGDDGRILVVDFGIAAWLEGNEADATPGRVHGTRGYIAPERLEGAPVDPRSDQFGFCVSLWESLFGLRPDADPKDERTAPTPTLEAKLAERLRALLRRGLARDPNERYPSMDALLDALTQACAPKPRRTLERSGLVLLVLAVAAVSIVVVLLTGSQREPPTVVAEPARARASPSDARGVCQGMDQMIRHVFEKQTRPATIVGHIRALSQYAATECPVEQRCPRLAKLLAYSLDDERRGAFRDPAHSALEHDALAQLLGILHETCPTPEARQVHACLIRDAAALEAELCTAGLLDAAVCAEPPIAASAAATEPDDQARCAELTARWADYDK